ncbi:WD40/YVTN/BNR-like repeat-containing protein [Pseudomonas veronii]|uniref:WD40/YVTN/BNR-like repeat-containing protein n=1 Tax=Pseudomonas veronii TaxID=76761 RepID=UPI0021C05F41|nr:YCF48-related protein [Pseudomonas veronii]MCT9826629.1 YCF48-related protein [Pseudomonas veronii]
MKPSIKQPAHLLALIASVMIATLASATELVAPLQPVPAARSSIATESPILAATWAGSRVVSVGSNGVILLSDEKAKSFRQAQSVPVSSTLTGVSFADSKNGWAVGHWGAILATIDGGETWQVQRLDIKNDRPLFAVHFFDSQRGVAVGLWSLVLVTQDGGKNWTERKISPKEQGLSDLNLINLFPDKNGGVFATAEQGRLLHSADSGNTWDYLNTGYEGSLWCGVQLIDGTLLVGGQRGTLLRSADGGQSWERIPLDSKSSITAIVANGLEVIVVGLDGLQKYSFDDGRTFNNVKTPSKESLTAALFAEGDRWLMFSRHGVILQNQ